MTIRTILTLLACSLMGLSACVSPIIEPGAIYESDVAAREEIVAQGMSLVGRKDLSTHNAVFRNDCSGLVVGLYRSLGYEVKLNFYESRYVAENLFRNLRAQGNLFSGTRPRKADLAFFRNTVENSGNRVTHVGLVAGIDTEETVTIIHYSSRGVSLMRMNLSNPGIHRDEQGNILNDFLRKKPAGPGDVQLLSGELFFTYGDLYSYIRH
jgi:hypothetical protein